MELASACLTPRPVRTKSTSARRGAAWTSDSFRRCFLFSRAVSSCRLCAARSSLFSEARASGALRLGLGLGVPDRFFSCPLACPLAPFIGAPPVVTSAVRPRSARSGAWQAAVLLVQRRPRRRGASRCRRNAAAYFAAILGAGASGLPPGGLWRPGARRRIRDCCRRIVGVLFRAAGGLASARRLKLGLRSPRVRVAL